MNNRYVPSERTLEKINVLLRKVTYVFTGTLAVEIGYSLAKTEMIVNYLIDNNIIRYATPFECRALGFDETYQILIKMK